MKTVLAMIPILAYVIIWLLTNRLINAKITIKADRKRYKRFFNSRLANLFAPIFLFFFLLAYLIFPKKETYIIFAVILFSLKVIIMLMQGAISISIFFQLKGNIHKLRTDTPENILKDIVENED